MDTSGLVNALTAVLAGIAVFSTWQRYVERGGRHWVVPVSIVVITAVILAAAGATS